MENFDIKEALNRYQVALNIIQATRSESSSQDILNVLTARDSLQQTLKELMVTDNEILLEIIELDHCWLQQAQWVTQKVDLEKWRKSFDPSEDAWWWYLEKPTHRLDRLDWLWSGVSLVFLTVAFSLLINISSRFLSGGADTLGAFAISSQAILTFLTAQGTLTSVGKQGIRKVLSKLSLPKYWLQEVELGLSVLLLISLFSFYSFLPKIGSYYRNSGLKDYKTGYLTSAKADYLRALALNPQDVESNFYLGLLYEDMQNIQQAKEQYQIASAGKYLPAYNNLARLYILEGQYRDAALLLQREKGLLQKISPKDVDLKYAYYKNLGWVQLQQNRLTLAKINLEQAINITKEKAPAYCLLAQVLEKTKTQKALAIANWEQCLAFATGSTPEEVDWIQLAQQRLSEAASSPKTP